MKAPSLHLLQHSNVFSNKNSKVSVSRCFLVLSLNHFHSFLLVSLQKPTENKDNLLKGTIFWWPAETNIEEPVDCSVYSTLYSLSFRSSDV